MFLVYRNLLVVYNTYLIYSYSLIYEYVKYSRGTGIRGLMRGMATLPQGNQNQKLLVVRDKVGRPQVSLG